MSCTNEQLMQELYEALIHSLLQRVKDGEAKAADLNVARQFLKDHNINADPKHNSALGELVDAIPDLPADMSLN